MGGTFSDYGNTEQVHLTERWKRLDDTHLLYGFTIDDPGTWTKPWSVEFVMWRLTDQEQLVEYACHEGNVGMEFTLSAARAKRKRSNKRRRMAKSHWLLYTAASREAVSNSAPGLARPSALPTVRMTSAWNLL